MPFDYWSSSPWVQPANSPNLQCCSLHCAAETGYNIYIYILQSIGEAMQHCALLAQVCKCGTSYFEWDIHTGFRILTDWVKFQISTIFHLQCRSIVLHCTMGTHYTYPALDCTLHATRCLTAQPFKCCTHTWMGHWLCILFLYNLTGLPSPKVKGMQVPIQMAAVRDNCTVLMVHTCPNGFVALYITNYIVWNHTGFT